MTNSYVQPFSPFISCFFFKSQSINDAMRLQQNNLLSVSDRVTFFSLFMIFKPSLGKATAGSFARAKNTMQTVHECTPSCFPPSYINHSYLYLLHVSFYYPVVLFLYSRLCCCLLSLLFSLSLSLPLSFDVFFVCIFVIMSVSLVGFSLTGCFDLR